jgi:hypothetical protein
MTNPLQKEQARLHQAMQALRRILELSERYHDAGKWIGVCGSMGFLIDAAKDVQNFSRALALKEMK